MATIIERTTVKLFENLPVPFSQVSCFVLPSDDKVHALWALWLQSWRGDNLTQGPRILDTGSGPGIMVRLCMCLCQADVILGWSPVLGWEWKAKGQASFTRMCFYSGNLNCWFSTRYLEKQERVWRGRHEGERRRKETQTVEKTACASHLRQTDWWSVFFFFFLWC